MNKNNSKYSITVNIKRDDEKALVYYKQDGQRFESNCTIKLNVETTYKFLLTFRPALKVKTGSLKSSSVEVKEESFTPEASSYALLWTSHEVCISKRNGRDRFPLSLNVEVPFVTGTLDIPFQFKFYGANDKSHSVWGNELHHIEFECTYKSDTLSFNIEKEVYR